MHTYDELFFNPAVRFSRQDCIAFEHVLAEAVHDALPYASYSLFFPQTPPQSLWPEGERRFGVAELIARERKALIPLTLRGEFLGVFVARGARMTAPKTLSRLLPRLASQCLEKLLLYKMGVTDPLTGLSQRLPFLAALEKEIDLVSNCLRPETGDCQELALGAYRASMGLVVVEAAFYDVLQREHGHLFADGVLADLGRLAADQCPETGLAGRPEETVLAFFLPGGTAKTCLQLAQAVQNALDGHNPVNPLTGQRIALSTGVGYTVFPKDAEGRVHELPPAEQARVLLRKAVMAACAAVGRGQPLGFGQLLDKGGRVLELVHDSRALIDLGRAAGAREGDRFLALPSRTELALVEVGENRSFAEIVQPGDPTMDISPGDNLERLAQQAAQEPGYGGETGVGLLAFREFNDRFASAREEAASFALCLVRLEPSAEADETLTNTAWELAREVLPEPVLAGRFAANTLIFYHPDAGPETIRGAYAALLARLESELPASVAVGAAMHPYLSFTKSDSLDNSRKALEYALLLPEPRVGVLDSLALNIHADRLFSQNDLYRALEEYKLALLADECNHMARNSLGVCLARMGRLAQAEGEFLHVLEESPKDIMALYNLGYVRQKMGENSLAAEAFAACLEQKPDHLFSRLRLGQLAESQGRLDAAREHYAAASEQEQGPSVADRYLARLALRQGDMAEARERLHQALRYDAKDALSLHLLAKLYLDGGEDPEVAETLARQSVALRPGKPEFWNMLARALDARGKASEAAMARARGAEL